MLNACLPHRLEKACIKQLCQNRVSPFKQMDPESFRDALLQMNKQENHWDMDFLLRLVAIEDEYDESTVDQLPIQSPKKELLKLLMSLRKKFPWKKGQKGVPSNTQINVSPGYTEPTSTSVSPPSRFTSSHTSWFY